MQNKNQINNYPKSSLKKPKELNILNRRHKPSYTLTHSKISSFNKTTGNINTQDNINNKKNSKNNSRKDLPISQRTLNPKKFVKETNEPKKNQIKKLNPNEKKITIQTPVSSRINKKPLKRIGIEKDVNKTESNILTNNENRRIIIRADVNRINRILTEKKNEKKNIGSSKFISDLNKSINNTKIENKNISNKKVSIITENKKTITKNNNKIQNNQTVHKIKNVVKIYNLVSKKSKEKKLIELSKQKIDKELESLPTFKKIVLLQNLLKEMRSIKDRFIVNKNNLIEKIYFSCYNYFNDKIYMKEIFDYCISGKPEEHIDCQLISDIQDYINKNLYQSLNDFLFLIRNNNYYMLKIIKFCDKFSYEELSDFFVNFLYENVINSSFAQDELILMIYLLIEDIFLNKLPNTLDFNINNIYNIYIKNNFLFYVFQQLTRKIDVRNFLSSILNESIRRMENYRASLSLDINISNRFLTNKDINIHHSYIQFAKGDSENTKIKKTKKHFKKKNIVEASLNHITAEGGGNRFLKRAKRITIGESIYNNIGNSWTIIQSKMSKSKSLNESSINNISNDNIALSEIDNEKNNCDINKNKSNLCEEDNNKDVEAKTENYEENYKKNEEEILKILNDKEEYDSQIIDENLNINEEKENLFGNEQEKKEEIDPFFEDNSVNLKYLKNKFLELKKTLNKNAINLAMKEYIKSLIIRIKNPEVFNNKDNSLLDYMKKESRIGHDYENIEDNDQEIFSTSLIIEELIKIREIKQVDSFRNLMKRIKFNHRIVKKITNNLIAKIKSNLISIPYVIKCILKIINTLIDKKYNIKLGNKLSNYNLYMFKINFFIGNIILPIITNPEYNGLITTNVISKITKENLKIISDIFETALSGQLFNKKTNPYMTLFNQYIIEIMPQLFEIVENIEKNCKLPKSIQRLIEENIQDNNNNERNINYNYFKENPNENIQYQSICFSWQYIFILLETIKNNQKYFFDDNVNEKEIKILENIVTKDDSINKLFASGVKNQKNEFFLLTKLNVKEDYEKEKLKLLTEHNFSLIIPKLNDDLITAYKKCLAEVLCYTNILPIENFIPFTFNKNDIIYDKDITKILSINDRKNEYEKIINKKNEISNYFKDNTLLKNYLKKVSLLVKYEEDADFKNIIFPEILKIIKREISFNLDSPISQRIIFCCNYLKLYLRNIPESYKKNNFCLLFMELIKETRNNIEFLKNDILFEFYLKLKESVQLNNMISTYSQQIRNFEKTKYIEYLYNKLKLPINLKIEKDQNGIITKIEYEKKLKLKKSMNYIEYLKNENQPIKNFIEEFPDFNEYEEEYDNILDIEEKAQVPEALTAYFKELALLIRDEEITKRFDKEELQNLIFDLESYILTKLYDKIFPSESIKDDTFFYKKCARLSFIKPHNVIPDKKLINEHLLEKSIECLNDIDDKLSPIEKIQCFGKAIQFVQSSISFSSGNKESGVDDIVKPLVYIIIKSKPKNIFSNYQYCELFLNSELAKRQYGVILTQIRLIIMIIKDMKYNDLIDVTEEEFGIDEKEDKSEEEIKKMNY